ncbi:MAG: hypothetical protein WC971_09235 [Coriobacteriia bacterium]
MNGYVHYRLTREWAIEEGIPPRLAEEVAYWDVWTDRFFPGSDRHSHGYHFLRLGACDLARSHLRRAVRDASAAHLGIALHCAQDAISHGRRGHYMHLPGTDRWERRSEGVRRRIETTSRRMLRIWRRFAPSERRATSAGEILSGDGHGHNA